MVAASWLKNASSRTLFWPLNYLFSTGTIKQDDFYPRLLAPGRIDKRQYFLPVSFNLPAIVFARENAGLLPDQFTVDPETVRLLGKNFNIEAQGAGGTRSWSKIGFSPSWNANFSFIVSTLFNTGFREAPPLVWNGESLEDSVLYLRGWIQSANINTLMEDDFSFKYFFQPPAKLVQSGRVLFAYLDSAELFTLAEDLRSALDFRWIAGNAALEGDEDAESEALIPVAENSVWFGICRNGKLRKTAEAFARWFFREDTQRFLLEESRRLRIGENAFGIARGFSTLRPVTEQVFPHFYPALLGHMPPAAALQPPDILPRSFRALQLRGRKIGRAHV
jgi:hypothetical protein